MSDYGAFRDLQRHRMLTLDWQEPDDAATDAHRLQTRSAEVRAPSPTGERVMDDSAALYERLARRNIHPAAAQYAVSMAYRIRFYMRMNAREAMHVIELRTSPQGHPAHTGGSVERMHRKSIADEAGHTQRLRRR